jgi:hypothetical protein
VFITGKNSDDIEPMISAWGKTKEFCGEKQKNAVE